MPEDTNYYVYSARRVCKSKKIMSSEIYTMRLEDKDAWWGDKR